MKKDLNRYYWWNGWGLAANIILLLVSIPVFTIIYKLLGPAGENWTHIKENLLLTYLANTALLMLGVGALSFVLGVSSAWVVTNYNFPFRRHIEWLLILPLAFPGYIMAYAYAGVFDYSGLLSSTLRNSFDIHFKGNIIDIMNLPGAILILSFTLFPYVFVISRVSFIRQSLTLQEASFLLGYGRLRTFFKVALPLARPGIVAGLALTLMEVLNDYGTVKYYGVETLTTGIFKAWFSFGDVGTAIYLAGILLVFVFLLLSIEKLQRGKRLFQNQNSMVRPIPRKQLSRKSGIITSSIFTLFLIIAFFIPFSQILYWVSITYQKVLNTAFFWQVYESFRLATIAALIVVSCSVVLLYAVRLSPFKWAKIIAKIPTLGYAIPGAVIAVGVLIPLISIDKWIIGNIVSSKAGLILTGTIFALIYAYVVRFMAVGYNPIESGFEKSGIKVNQASRLLGKGSFYTLMKVDLPLIKTSILSAFLLVFVDVLKELPLTLILRPFNFHTLATKTFDMATNEMIAESSNAALIIILTGVIPIMLINKLINTKAS
jgi:iron(III) transport system permease protein